MNGTNRFLEEQIMTASPEARFLMLYDRLLVDLDRARDAIVNNQIEAAHVALIHGQEIIQVLRNSMRTDIWPGGEDVRQLYGYAFLELVKANTTKSLEPLERAESVLRPLGEAWHQASEKAMMTRGAFSGVA